MSFWGFAVRRINVGLVVVSALALAGGVVFHALHGPGPHEIVPLVTLAVVVPLAGAIFLLEALVPRMRRLAQRLSLPRLQWVTTLLPPLGILAIDGVVYALHQMGILYHTWEHVLLGGVIFAASLPFSLFVFDVFRRIQREMVAQNKRLAAMEERERIAREMHDNFGQVLGYINTKAQAARLMCEEGHTEKAHDQIRQLEEATRQLYGDIRDAILGLRSTGFLDRGLVAALELYTRQFADQTGIETSFEPGPGADGISWRPEVEVQVFRIVQEALTNVRKHARAARARVLVLPDGPFTEIAVEDQGVGFDLCQAMADGAARFGLRTMQERAEAIGAQFEVSSKLGAGTRVSLRVPAAPLGRGAE